MAACKDETSAASHLLCLRRVKTEGATTEASHVQGETGRRTADHVELETAYNRGPHSISMVYSSSFKVAMDTNIA